MGKYLVDNNLNWINVSEWGNVYSNLLTFGYNIWLSYKVIFSNSCKSTVTSSLLYINV